MFYIKRKLIISRKVLCDFESYRNRTCKSCTSCPTNNSNARQTASSKKADDKQLQQAQITDLQFYADQAEKGKVEFKQYTPVLLEDQERAIADENASEKTTAKTANTSRTTQIPLPAEPIYYYHPDHLGTSTFLTDANGNAYQFFLNLPFGETMAEQLGTSYYKSPYKFNGKELDEETGLYYYGARYYNPKTSLWLSVDPLAEKYPSWNPYNYTMGNPINLIDPDGRCPIQPGVLLMPVYNNSKELTGYKFTPTAIHLLSLVTGINEINIKNTNVQFSKLGSGSLTMVGSSNEPKIIHYIGEQATNPRYTITFLKRNAHEIGHFPQLEDGNAAHFSISIFQYIRNFISGEDWHDGKYSTKEKAADIGEDKFREFNNFVNIYYGKDKLKKLLENKNNSEQVKINRIDNWWKKFIKETKKDEKK